MSHKKKIFTSVLFTFLLVLTTFSLLYSVFYIDSQDYVLKAGDVLHLEVVSAEDFFAPLIVSPDGYVSLFPFAGSVKVGGTTLAVAKSLITDSILENLKNARVNIELIEVSPQIIHLKGAVVKPGVVVTEKVLPLTEVLKLNEGLLPNASRRVRIIRQGRTIEANLNDYHRKGDKTQNPILLHNDIVSVDYAEQYVTVYVNTEISSFMQYYEIEDSCSLDELMLHLEIKPADVDYFELYVERNNLLFEEIDELKHKDIVYLSIVENNIYVSGSVNYPGSFSYNPNSSVNYYLGLAGGVDSNGNRNKIFIIKSDGSRERYKGQKLYNGDTIFVTQKFTVSLRDWLTPISSVLSIVTTIIVLTR